MIKVERYGPPLSAAELAELSDAELIDGVRATVITDHDADYFEVLGPGVLQVRDKQKGLVATYAPGAWLRAWKQDSGTPGR